MSDEPVDEREVQANERKILLEGLEYAVRRRVAEELARNVVDVEVMYDDLSRSLVAGLRVRIWAHRLAEWSEIVELPATWFQHLKKSLGLKHRTVIREGHVVRYRVYPDADYVLSPTRSGESWIHEVRS
jgi:hypothetical protein